MPTQVFTPMYIPIDHNSCSEGFQADMAICQTYSTKQEIRQCLEHVKKDYAAPWEIIIIGTVILLVVLTYFLYKD